MTLTPEERAKAAETARIGTRAAAKTAFGMYLKVMGIAALIGLVLMLGMCSMLFHALR